MRGRRRGACRGNLGFDIRPAIGKCSFGLQTVFFARDRGPFHGAGSAAVVHGGNAEDRTAVCWIRAQCVFLCIAEAVLIRIVGRDPIRLAREIGAPPRIRHTISYGIAARAGDGWGIGRNHARGIEQRGEGDGSEIKVTLRVGPGIAIGDHQLRDWTASSEGADLNVSSGCKAVGV